MDEPRFDDPSTITGTGRRTVLKGLLAGLLLPVGVAESETEAAKGRHARRRKRRRRQRRRANSNTPSNTAQAFLPGIGLRVVNTTNAYLLARFWHGTIGWVRDEGVELVRDRSLVFDTADLHAGIEVWNHAAHPFIWAEQPVSLLPPPPTPNANIQSGGSMSILGYVGERMWDRRDMAVGTVLANRVPLDAGSSIGVSIRREQDDQDRRVFMITFTNP